MSCTVSGCACLGFVSNRALPKNTCARCHHANNKHAVDSRSMEEKEKAAEDRVQLSSSNIRDLIAKARNRRDGSTAEEEAGIAAVQDSFSTSALDAALADRRAHTDEHTVEQHKEAAPHQSPSVATGATGVAEDMNIGTIRKPAKQLSERGALFVR